MPKCEQCRGTGTRDLTRVETRVFSAVVMDWRTTAEVHEAIPAKARPIRTALCNMLVKLAGLGLVERDDSKREGRWRIAR